MDFTSGQALQLRHPGLDPKARTLSDIGKCAVMSPPDLAFLGIPMLLALCGYPCVTEGHYQSGVLHKFGNHREHRELSMQREVSIGNHRETTTLS